MKLEDIARLRNMANPTPTAEDRARIRIAELDFDVNIGPTGHYFLTAADEVKQRGNFGCLESALRSGEREYAGRQNRSKKNDRLKKICENNNR